MPWDDDDNPHTEQVHIDEHHEWDCIFSKKTVAQWKPNIKCSTCHAGKNRGSRMRVCERCGRMYCAMQTTRNTLRSGNNAKEKRRGRNKADQGIAAGQEGRRQAF